jgi:hypothetical protein
LATNPPPASVATAQHTCPVAQLAALEQDDVVAVPVGQSLGLAAHEYVSL